MSYYYDDFREDQVFQGPGRTITETDIIQFAHMYDHLPIHIDRMQAQNGRFHGVIASGLQTPNGRSRT